MVDFVTIIRAKGKRLTKRHTPNGASGYGSAFLVESKQVKVASAKDLHKVLTGLETQTSCCVIRGFRRIEMIDKAEVRRAYHPDPEKPHLPPGFEPRSRRWLCVDIDNLLCPEELDPEGDPDGAVLYALTHLPDWLRDVSCHWQWSSSAGLNGWEKLKLHLWFWLDKEVDDPALRAWASKEAHVDPALYNPVQPHYTASPIFADGLSDPVEQRSGLLEGERDTAIVPEAVWRWTELEEKRRATARAERAARHTTYTVSNERQRAWIRVQVDAIKSDLMASAASQMHPAALKAAGSLANSCYWGWIAESEARAVLDCSPIADIPKRDGELDRLWRWALIRAQADGPLEPDLGPDRPPHRPSSQRRPEPPPISENPTTPPLPGGGAEGGDPGAPPDEPPDDDVDNSDNPPGRDDDGILWNLAANGVWWGIEFGRRAAKHRVDIHGRPTVWVYAYDFEPTGHTVDVVTGQTGVRVSYRDQSGKSRTAVLPSSAWVEKRPAGSAAGTLADEGAVIAPGQGANLVLLLGQWAMATRGRPELVRQVVRRSGWHKDKSGQNVFVNGPNIHGANWLWEGQAGARGEIAGDVASWLQEVGSHVTTPGLLFVLGLSLAGPMLKPLERRPFMAHLAGGSSSGKSVASELASSLWGHPKRLELRWRTTDGALNQRLGRRNDAFAVLDEVQEQPSITKVSQIVHGIAGAKDKDRLTRQAKLREREEWSLTALSTGEISIAQYLGSSAQGGHAVRAMDLAIERGDLTTSAEHSEAIERATKRHYGAVGDAWCQRLAQMSEDDWTEIGTQVTKFASSLTSDTPPELRRILPQISLCAAALVLANEFGLVPDLGDDTAPMARTAALWALSRILEARGEKTCPEARAWSHLVHLHETQPYRFPTESQFRAGGLRDVVGVCERSQTDQERTGWVFVTAGLIREEIKQQCNTKVFFDWVKKNNLGKLNTTAASQKSRVGDQTRKWWRLAFCVCDDDEEIDASNEYSDS